jgi:putative helicase MOV10L1
VNVGSIDDFQGQEMKVILISTVLTNCPDDNGGGGGGGGGSDGGSGFLGDEKRFCVAVTRAKALTMVIGHPTVLMRDKCWGEMLRYCAVNGAYCGCECADLVSGRQVQQSIQICKG